MIKLSKDMILYHGSYIEVNKIDLNKCEDNKDFGKGFYLTTSKEQAISFVKLSINKAKSRKLINENISRGYLSVFKLDSMDNLKIKYFETADKEWLHYVVANREVGKFKDLLNLYKDYNVIVGKIANDRTASTLQAYVEGIFGEVGTETADNAAISTLLPEKLENQICFKTEDVIRNLKFIDSCEVNG